MGVRVRLLGGLAIEGVDLAALGSAKARLVVRRLAVERGRPVSTDALVDVLWPYADAPARPADQLSVLVSRSRAVLGADAIIRNDAGYALALDWLDVDALGELVDEASARLAEGRHSAASGAVDADRARSRRVHRHLLAHREAGVRLGHRRHVDRQRVPAADRGRSPTSTG